MNVEVARGITTLLSAAIEVLLTDPFYRDILLTMQSEGRSEPSDAERAAINARLDSAQQALRDEIAARKVT